MKCEDVEAIVFSDREASKEEMNAAWEHAQTCPACKALLNEIDVLSGAREIDKEVEVPAAFTARWQAEIRKTEQQEGFWKRFVVSGGWRRAAAYAMCAVVFFGAGSLLGGERMKTASGGAPSIAYDAPPEMMMRGRAMPAMEEKMVTYTARIDLTTGQLEDTVEKIKVQAIQAGGSVVSCDVRTNSEDEKRADMELTVPSGELDSLLNAVKTLGTVESESIFTEDITENYQDNASRLDSAKARKDRLDELYAQAQDMNDIIAVNEALFEVQAEIDDLSGQKAGMEDQVENARLTIGLKEAKEDEAFLTRIEESAKNGIKAFGVWLGDAAAAVVYALPWIAVFAAAGLAIRAIVRKIKRK